MKMLTRVMLLMVFLLTLAVPAVAQEDQLCFGLDEAQCDLFYNPGPEDFGSFAFDYSFALSTSGGEEPPVNVNSNGSGNWSLVPDAADPLKGFNMAMSLVGEAQGEGETQSGSLEFRIIDGVFYANAEELGGWKYAELQTLIESGGMPFDPGMLAGGEGMAGMADAQEMMAAMGPLSALLEKHITVTSEATPDGGTNFALQFSLGDFLMDPELSQGLNEVMPSLMENPAVQEALGAGGEMTEEELQQMQQQLPMLVGMFGMFLSQTDIGYTEKVSADGSFAGFVVNFDMTFDPSMMGMGSMDEDAPPPEPMVISLTLDVNVSNYDAGFEYQVPEGATPIENLPEMDMGM